jgi:hypothetical protein
MKAEGMQEPEVMEYPQHGLMGLRYSFVKGPVSVQVFEDPGAGDPRKEYPDTPFTDAEVKAWEKGEVFTFWVNYHDGEADVDGNYYGWPQVEQAALEALDAAWQRYVEAHA